VKILVLTSEPLGAGRLRAALAANGLGRDALELAEVMIIAPALHENALRFWVSDADEAIARANEIARATVAELDREGVEASAAIGESDPVAAIEDALVDFPADEILVFTHHDGEQQRYREDLDREAVRRQLAVPVRFQALDGPKR
jgi:hypothetical protein